MCSFRQLRIFASCPAKRLANAVRFSRVNVPPFDPSQPQATNHNSTLEKKSIHKTLASDKQFYFENGLRKVVPRLIPKHAVVHRQDFDVVGKTVQGALPSVLRILGADNMLYSLFPQVLEKCIDKFLATGRILVNTERVSASYVFSCRDHVTFLYHRHESPVVSTGLKILHDDSDFLVINKPCSLPVQAAGYYNSNSLLKILQTEYNYSDLHRVHRLDAMTSGVVILLKRLALFGKIRHQLATRKISKEYLAMVEGHFPSEPVSCDLPIAPIGNSSYNMASPDGKPAFSRFELLGVKDGYSLVRCYPVVGDCVYGNSNIFGPSRGKHSDFGGQSPLEVREKLMRDYTRFHWFTGNSSDLSRLVDLSIENYLESSSPERETDHEPGCSSCFASHLPELKASDMVMYLHALKYTVTEAQLVETNISRPASRRKPQIYVDNVLGLRKVKPYFNPVSVKFPLSSDKIVGRTLFCVYTDTKTHEIHKDFFKVGLIQVNGAVVDGDYVLKDGDQVKRVFHIHEEPVLHPPLTIVHMDDELVVINKSCSVPMARQRIRAGYNSVLGVLRHDFGLKHLRLVHRLDMMTSGLLLVARTPEMAKKISEQIKNHEVRKEYLCLVEGHFPWQSRTYKKRLCGFENFNVFFVCRRGRSAETTFELIHAADGVSLVRALPKTGRTHQIRVHLRHLGFPIVGDKLYGNRALFNDFGISKALKKETLDKLRPMLWAHYSNDPFYPSLERDFLINFPDVNSEEFLSRKSLVTEDYDPYCAYCHVPSVDPTREEMAMCLHSLKYSGPDWEYSSTVPDWALKYL